MWQGRYLFKARRTRKARPRGRFAWREGNLSGTKACRGRRFGALPAGFARQASASGLVSETFNAVLTSSPGARIGARGATRFSTSLQVVSTMWTEPRNPNIAPLMPRPHECGGRVHPSAPRGGLYGAGGGAHTRVDMPWLFSGGKVIPQSGQEHPRTEL